MDQGTPLNYCVPCRRHLNGAYSCPGCGAPASAAVPQPAAGPAVEPRPAGRARRRTGRGRRLVLVTAAGLVIGGAGVVALAAPQDTGTARPGSAPTEEHPVQTMPSLTPASASTAPASSAAPRPSRSAKPSASSSGPAASTPPAARPSEAPSSAAPAPTTAAPTGRPTGGASPSPTSTCKPFLFWCT